MKRVCPRCQETVDQGSSCPRCAAVWTSPTATHPSSPGGSAFGPPTSWQHTPGGRVLIGVLLALGLCFGLLRLCAASFVAFGAGAEDGGVSPLTRLFLFQGLQALALVAGGIFAGAGQRRGAGLGAIVGVMSGLLVITAMLDGFFVFVDRSFLRDLLTPGTTVRNVTLYGLPVLFAFCGALGGFIGGVVWKPLAEIDSASGPMGASAGPGSRRAAFQRVPWLSDFSWTGPVAWGRVIAGTTVAVAGAVWTNAILNFLILATQGKLSILTAWEDQVSYGEVFSLSILIGGCVAGTNTFNGLRQGVFVGIGGALVLGMLFLGGSLGQSVPAVYPVLSTLFLGPIGGWFGSELLPPVYVAPRRRRSTRFS
jgi:hypothetical protein